MTPKSLNIARALAALTFAVIVPILNINSERLRLRTAESLLDHGKTVAGEITGIAAEQGLALPLVPHHVSYTVGYRFAPEGMEPVEARASMDRGELSAFMKEGEELRSGSKLSLLYLPEAPSVSMPTTKLADGLQLHWAALGLYCLCSVMAAIGADKLLRRQFAPSAPVSPNDISDEELRRSLEAMRAKDRLRKTAARKQSNRAKPAMNASGASVMALEQKPSAFGRRDM